MQLVAYGAQDIYLTGNPQITFFKVVYRRHTNFSMECIRQTINGSSGTNGSNTTGNVTISRNGDLVHKVYVTSSTNGIFDGSDIVSEAELEIGGQRIDRHYKDWNEAWNELSTDESKSLGLKSMQGCIGTSSSSATGAALPGQLNLVQVPLNFWFCRNPGLALPLIALQYHEVKVKIIFGITTDVGSTNATCEVWCDYIYLDTDERRRFAQVSHEYLIEQIQRQTEPMVDNIDVSLNFNHPVKELVWTYPTGTNLDKVQLKLNGHDRFAVQNEPYFTLRQPYDYHSAVPRQNLPTVAQALGGVSMLGLQNVNIIAESDISTGGALGLTGGTLSLTGVGTALTATPATDSFQLVMVQTVASGSGEIEGQNGAEGNIYVGTATFQAAGTLNVSNLVLVVTGAGGGGGLTAGTPITDITQSGTHEFVLHRITTNAQTSQARTSRMTNKIGVYSFALKPEEHQPSGTCNFSRIDNAQLTGTGTTSTESLIIYAVNYNVLRIMSGMGGLAYSN